MFTAKRKKLARWLPLKWLLSLVCCLPFLAAQAEQLPVKNYSIADGLAHDEIAQIVQDSRGFLWFCTNDGLSRFDGYRFTTYGVKDGLPVPNISYLFETRSGVYWVATQGGGVSRFDPSGSPAADGKNGTRKLFTSYRIGETELSNFVDKIYEDSKGRIWIGTDSGLYLLSEKDDGSVTFEQVKIGPFTLGGQREAEIKGIVEDAEGHLYIATHYGLVRLLPDGRQIHYAIRTSHPTDTIWALLLDKEKRLWLGHQAGLMVFRPEPASLVTTNEVNLEQVAREFKEGALALPEGGLLLPDAAGKAAWFTIESGLANNNVQALHQSADGRVWIGTRGGGLSIFDGKRFLNYAASQGLNNRINDLAEDHAGNLWIGTQASGAIKITGNGLVSFREADGLGNPEIIAIFETNAGELCAISSKWTINRFDGERFTAIRPNLPKKILDSSSGRWVMIEDHEGDWWVATGVGLYRFPKVARLEDLARVTPQVYTTRDGLADNNISRLFEDSRGDVWISSYNPPVMLTRWERATNTIHRYTEKEGHPTGNWTNVFGEDAAGNVWIGMHNGGLARVQNGRLEMFGAADGVPAGLTQGFYRDRANRLWFATSLGGAVCVEEPASARPRIVTYTTAENLASNNLRAFTEDGWGNMYLGTARGVDRLDAQTSRVKHFTTADGLLKSEVTAAFRDRNGALWFGTREGLSRLFPETEKPQAAPPVLIGGLRVAGIARAISELGEQEVKGLEFGAGENQIEIDFFGLNFSAGGGLRYQYKFEGSDEDWSAPTNQRTVTASLAPGAYRFLVRAVNSDGNFTLNPASISFTILPPIWQRWWFLMIAAVFITATIYLIERYRVARAIELERVRTRIATDLHDDIGASLSQIAIMSEVVSQRVDGSDAKVNEPLQMIAGTSREMVDAMSDIVWAINPKRDHLSDLTQRMRRFASDIMSAREIDFRFRVPVADEKNIRLGADLRREVYLIFKESVNNLVKYSECTDADLEFKIEADYLIIRVSDNGKGFDVEGASNGNHTGMGGHGLASMRKRAEALGGSYDVKSEKGKGTTVLLKVPIGGRRTKILSWKKIKRET